MITKGQCAAARGLLGVSKWTQAYLAKAAGLGESTVRNFEKGRGAQTETSLKAIEAALRTAGVELVPENGGGAGVRLSKPGGPKKVSKAKGKK